MQLDVIQLRLILCDKEIYIPTDLLLALHNLQQ
jgi:hypothetical protein